MRSWIDSTMAKLQAYAVSQGPAAGPSGDPFSSPSDSFLPGYDLSPSPYPSPYGGVDPSYVDEPYSG